MNAIQEKLCTYVLQRTLDNKKTTAKKILSDAFDSQKKAPDSFKPETVLKKLLPLLKADKESEVRENFVKVFGKTQATVAKKTIKKALDTKNPKALNVKKPQTKLKGAAAKTLRKAPK